MKMKYKKKKGRYYNKTLELLRLHENTVGSIFTQNSFSPSLSVPFSELSEPLLLPSSSLQFLSMNDERQPKTPIFLR